MKKLKCGRQLEPEMPAPKGPASDAWKELLAEYGEDKGMRQSQQRTTIAEIIMATQGHFNVQEVARHVQQKSPSIGAATVYRTVALLHDAGLLKETLVNEDGTTIYEVADGDHHDHIVCLDCGHITEFHDERIEKVQKAATAKLNFTEIRHRHVIYARCQFFNKA